MEEVQGDFVFALGTSHAHALLLCYSFGLVLQLWCCVTALNILVVGG